MKRILCIILLAAFSQQVFAWGQNGHRMVAQICYDNLDEKTKKEIDQLLNGEPLARIATWPDFIRSEKAWDFTKSWHFITIDPDKTVKEVIKESANDPEINNVVEAIELMQAILNGDRQAEDQFEDLMKENKVEPLQGSIKLTALAFFIHFVGDVHQPMHVGKNNDYGGNKISVQFFGERTNLHSVWDEGIIEQEKLAYSDFARFIDSRYQADKAGWQKDSIREWAEESVEKREKIYNTLYDQTDRDSGLPDMSYAYQHDFLPVVEARIAAAGYRASSLLNNNFQPTLTKSN